MTVYAEQITVSTEEGVQDISAAVEEAVTQSGVTEGQCLIYSPHSTVAILINEQEEGLSEDLHAFLGKLLPDDWEYAHNENRADHNARAHLTAMLFDSGSTVPVLDGTLALGTWQSILLLESDEPQDRTVVVQITGE